MLHKLGIVCGVVLLGYAGTGPSQEQLQVGGSSDLPSIETFVMEPIALEHINVWVPANKAGPIVNRACRPQQGCFYSCLLPANVQHARSERCPDAAARLLAEYVAPYHEETLPLTILNGWQWEYSYSLSQYESASYDLPARGGGWEYALEAVFSTTEGSITAWWLPATDGPNMTERLDKSSQSSDIHVTGFTLARTRNGYPKNWQF